MRSLIQEKEVGSGSIEETYRPGMLSESWILVRVPSLFFERRKKNLWDYGKFKRSQASIRSVAQQETLPSGRLCLQQNGRHGARRGRSDNSCRLETRSLRAEREETSSKVGFDLMSSRASPWGGSCHGTSWVYSPNRG